MRKTETLNLRVSTEFKRKLENEAKKEKRSVTNYLEATLARLWEQESTSLKPKNRKDSQT
jgi:predicted HicB family RNase H-like nuclease